MSFYENIYSYDSIVKSSLIEGGKSSACIINEFIISRKHYLFSLFISRNPVTPEVKNLSHKALRFRLKIKGSP